jgi:hypothetical protein
MIPYEMNIMSFNTCLLPLGECSTSAVLVEPV